MRRLLLAAILTGAVGCGGRGPVGGSWYPTAVPGAMGVTAVWSFAPDDVWAGSQIVLHFDGATWTEVATPTAGLVADLWGFAPDDLYAVTGVTLLRWNGAAWSAVDFGGAIAPTDLQAVWGTSDDDLWLGDTLDSQVFHWNGTAWSTTVAQTVNVEDLWGVSGAAGGPIFAAGTFGISRWNGSAWSSVTGTAVTGGAGALWGFAAGDVWEAGGAGTLAHWDGAGWTDTTPDEATNFIAASQSIWGAAPDDVWAVGALGTIDHWDGKGWTQVLVGAFPYYPTLNKVHGSSADDVWAVGLSTDGKNSGVILHHTP
ncbi:MAG TPA: hypothetical protein VI456_02190 [Polyangia bacterium]